jgi:tungstate transport system substrate-binding protein
MGTHTWRSLRATAATALAAVLVFALAACSATPSQPAEKPAAEPKAVILASTTSTQDSGLFDVLIPAFEKANPGYKVKVIAVGTGEALKLGEKKEADVLLVHAKADEEKFVAAGFGFDRRDVMFNNFVIVGPKADPAKIANETSAAVAFAAIAKAKAPFVSRGDNSGTNKKEIKLWKESKATTATPWYLETGQGMGETLRIASEKGAYTLTDEATYLSMKDSLDLVVVAKGAKGLKNQYGVIQVTGAKEAAGAAAFADWIVGADGQKVIGEYGVAKFGQPLFTPDATGTAK